VVLGSATCCPLRGFIPGEDLSTITDLSRADKPDGLLFRPTFTKLLHERLHVHQPDERKKAA